MGAGGGPGCEAASAVVCNVTAGTLRRSADIASGRAVITASRQTNARPTSASVEPTSELARVGRPDPRASDTVRVVIGAESLSSLRHRIAPARPFNHVKRLAVHSWRSRSARNRDLDAGSAFHVARCVGNVFSEVISVARASIAPSKPSFSRVNAHFAAS